MPIFHLNSLPKQKRIQMIGEFYDVFDSLKDRNEIRLFLKSLLGPEEIATLMRRVEIAVLLSASFKYTEIAKMLGVGNNKISNVQRALQQDDNGYKIIIKRLMENRKRRLKKIKDADKKNLENMSPLSALKKVKGGSVLPNLIDAVIEKLEDDKELEKEALLFTPSRAPFSNRPKK